MERAVSNLRPRSRVQRDRQQEDIRQWERTLEGLPNPALVDVIMLLVRILTAFEHSQDRIVAALNSVRRAVDQHPRARPCCDGVGCYASTTGRPRAPTTHMRRTANPHPRPPAGPALSPRQRAAAEQGHRPAEHRQPRAPAGGTESVPQRAPIVPVSKVRAKPKPKPRPRGDPEGRFHAIPRGSVGDHLPPTIPKAKPAPAREAARPNSSGPGNRIAALLATATPAELARAELWAREAHRVAAARGTAGARAGGPRVTLVPAPLPRPAPRPQGPVVTLHPPGRRPLPRPAQRPQGAVVTLQPHVCAARSRSRSQRPRGDRDAPVAEDRDSTSGGSSDGSRPRRPPTEPDWDPIEASPCMVTPPTSLVGSPTQLE